MESKQSEIKVGDELVFRDGYTWYVHKVTKVTPSGRIVCGFITLNPDMSIRGRSIWGTMSCLGLLTEELREKIADQLRRRRCLNAISNANWDTLPTESLEAIRTLIVESKESKEASDK